MAFARHNIEKHRLIEMVRMNPILWDCRLPHYKRSDKKKDIKWNELGRVFAVSGERVQRTFTSLREIFRRELNHEKMLGNRFKSKWEYYDAMGFLKNVIRERKTRDRIKPEFYHHSVPLNLHNGLDEYQYFPAREPKFPQHHQLQQQQHQQQQLQLHQRIAAPTHSDVILNEAATRSSPQQNLPSNIPHHTERYQHQPQDEHGNLTARSRSSTPSVCIKEEPHEMDEMATIRACSTIARVTSIDPSDANQNHKSQSNQPTNIAEAIPKRSAAMMPCYSETDSPTSTKGRYNAKETSGYNRNSHNDRDTRYLDLGNDDDGGVDANDGDNDDDDDDDDDVIESDVAAPSAATAGIGTIANARISPREILYTKFGDFLSARLNTLSETVANDLMNKILLLVAEK